MNEIIIGINLATGILIIITMGYIYLSGKRMDKKIEETAIFHDQLMEQHEIFMEQRKKISKLLYKIKCSKCDHPLLSEENKKELDEIGRRIDESN